MYLAPHLVPKLSRELRGLGLRCSQCSCRALACCCLLRRLLRRLLSSMLLLRSGCNRRRPRRGSRSRPRRPRLDGGRWLQHLVQAGLQSRAHKGRLRGCSIAGWQRWELSGRFALARH